MSANSATPATALGSIEALKRVKATETDWEVKLRVAQDATDEALRRLRDESEAAVKAAQVSADAERAQAVQAARGEAEREAAEILADGTRAAAGAAREEGKRAADKRATVLGAVLAGFAEE